MHADAGTSPGRPGTRATFEPGVDPRDDRGRRMLSAVLFSPRGGSAHVARAIVRYLPRFGWAPTLLTGSRSDAGPGADANRFYAGLDVRAVDFSEALRAPDPMGFDGEPGRAPMHPSYEERSGAPDRVFASLGDAEYERQVSAWAGELERAEARGAEVLHLHHLTPINEAAARVAAGVPVVGQVHGTELLMLEQIAAGAPTSWAHAEDWAERMRGWARRCERILVAPNGIDRAATLLGVDRDRFAPTPNGFDPERFKPRQIDRAAHWRRHLVEEPRGWLPGGGPGSVRYRPEDLEALTSGVVLIYVGRFTEVKRLPLLIQAFARASPQFRRRAALVLVGGHAGEWEGEHPAEVIAASGAKDVFLAGWHEHDDLPTFLAASDLFVLSSAREQFGQVLVEAMACGLPAIAARSFGPTGILADGQAGWLVPPDDEAALTAALVEAVNDEAKRIHRGRVARASVLERYSWPAVVAEISKVLLQASRRRSADVTDAVES